VREVATAKHTLTDTSLRVPNALLPRVSDTLAPKTGSTVQVFLLAHGLSDESWNGTGSTDQESEALLTSR
jgi:hypothetical protein